MVNLITKKEMLTIPYLHFEFLFVCCKIINNFSGGGGMAKAKKAKQLSFVMPNKVGLLAAISAAVADANVNITAICAYGMGKKAYVMLLTENNTKAKKALGSLKVKVEEEDVISVEMPHKVGELQKVAKRIADAGIDIIYMYGTAGAGKFSTCVLKTENDNKAIKAVNK
jgi:hypothetical protein